MNSSSEDDVSAHTLSLLSGTEERQAERKSSHRIRKVTEGTAPSGYLGFSVLHKSGTASDGKSHGLSEAENSTKFTKSSPLRRVARQHIRALDPKPNTSRPLKRFVATATKHTDTNGPKNNTSSKERKSTRNLRAAQKPSQSLERKIAGNKLHSTVREFSQASVPNNTTTDNLPVTAAADHEPGHLSVLEQVQRLIGANEFGVNNECTKTVGLSDTRVPSKKGLYRASRKSKRPVHESAPPPEDVCKRQRGVSRADLQALVRKQREARKIERLNKERAERERRERIQRNLIATAQAAAVAAKAPIPSPRRPLVLTDRNTAKEIDDRYRDPAKLIPHESNEDFDFASERQRKLDELLKNDDEQGIVWSPRILNGFSVDPKSARSVGSRSNWTIGSASSVNHLAPNRPTNHRVTGPPWVREPIVRKDAYSETAVQDWRTRSQSTTTAVPVDYASFPQPGPHRLQTLSKQSDLSPRKLEPLWIPLSCHVPGSGSNTQNEQHSVLVLNPVESQHDDEHGASSVSSLEEVSAPDTARWMRLEAVGASEPEASAVDEPGGQFVDDLKSSHFDPIKLEHRVDELLRLSRAPIVTNLDGCTELTAFNEIHTSDYLDLKRFIYSDPLRLGVLMKRQKRSTMPMNGAKAISVSQQLPFTTVSNQPCWNHSYSKPRSTPVATFTPRSPVTTPSSHDPKLANAHDRTSRTATQTAKSPQSAQSIIDPNVINTTTSTSPCQETRSTSTSEQQDFNARATSDAVSSTPRRETVRAISLFHDVARQTAPSLVHGASLPPRLTAAALSLRLSEEVNHLEALACSIQHVADMESLRQFAGAQTETVALAQLLKSQQAEQEPKSFPSPKVSTPRKQPISVRSQATSVTPETLHSHHGLHSPQFAEVIRAAEEFHKVERRLNMKAAQMETPRANRRSSTVSEASSPTEHIKIPSEECSYGSVADASRSVSSLIQLDGKSSTNRSPDIIRQTSVVASEFSTAPSDSSSPNSARSLPTDVALSAADDSTSFNHSATLVFQEKLTSEAHSISTASGGTPSLVKSIKSEISTGSPTDVQLRCATSIKSNVCSPSQRSPSLSGSVHEPSSTGHQTKASLPPTDIPLRNVMDSTGPARGSVTPLNRTDEGSDDVLSLTQIDSGLSKRAAILKMRRERAEKLLALSKNLEKEEAEVVRLEMEALKAYQAKRKRARVEATKHHIPNLSAVSSTTIDRATSFSPKHSRRSTDHKGTSVITSSPSCRSKGHEMDNRSRTLTPHTASPSGDSMPSVRDLSNLSRSNLIPQTQAVTASIGTRDETIQESFLQSGQRVSSVLRTISTVTSKQSQRSTACGLHTQKNTPRVSDENIHTSILSNRSKRSENRSQRGHVNSTPSESDTGSSTPKLREHLITTADLVSSSSDRVTPPTPKQQQPKPPPQHATTVSHLEFSYTGRRRHISASNMSGPTSADSMDEDHGTEVLTAEDQSVSVASVSNSSQVDQSAMESRIRALHANLQRQEAILARINQQHKYMSTDRLVRFESTVLQHKQLCTDIIESIKRQLRDCQPACSHSLSSSPSAERTEPGSKGCSIVSRRNRASVIDVSAEVSVPCKSATEASRFEEPQDESQIQTLVSLADDLVSATDTEGDLQKLGFDDKVESTASSATLGEETATSSTMTSPDLQPSKNTVHSNEQSPRVNDEISVNDSVKSISDAVSSTIPSGRATSTNTHEYEDEVQTPVRLELTAIDDDRLVVAANPPHENLKGLSCLTLKHAEEHGLSPPPLLSLENHVTSSEPVPQYTLIQLSPSVETDFITTVNDEPHSGLTTVTTAKAVGNGVVLKPLPCSFSVKLDAISDSPYTSVSDAEAAHVSQVPLEETNDVLDFPQGTGDIMQPTSGTQSVLQSATTDSVRLAVDARTPTLVENLTKELFKKLVSDVINDAMHSQETKKNSMERADADDMGMPELSQSMVCLRDPLDKPVEVELKSEVTESLADSESLSDTGDASLSAPVPSIFSTENIRGLVADVPARTEPLIRLAFDYLWQKRLEAPDGAREPALSAVTLTPLNAFQFNLLEDEDLNPELYSLPNLRFINRRLLLDLVCEVMQHIYEGEDEEFARRQTGQPDRLRVTSSQFRLWQGHKRPTEKEHIYAIVHTHVQQVLGLRGERSMPISPDANMNFSNLSDIPGKLSSGTRFSRLAQWTLSKKPYLDRLLELELRADESSWLSYVPEEQRLKQNLSQQIWDELVQDAIGSMLKATRYARSNGPKDPAMFNVEVAM